MARDGKTFWGYRTDTWKDWFPLDLGCLEMDYEGGPFWAYVMDTYGDDFAVGGRKTWEGPSFDACQTQVGRSRAWIAYRPHNFKFFEAWNAMVRNKVHAVDPDIRLDQYPWEYCEHAGQVLADESFLHVGQRIHCVCRRWNMRWR